MPEKIWLSIGNELIELVKNQFPQHAEFISRIDQSFDSYVVTIRWKLNNDPKRPNKISRIIEIIIPGEVIDDSNYNKRFGEVQVRFKNYISSKIKLFNPEHDNSLNTPPPVEEWLVDNHFLNS